MQSTCTKPTELAFTIFLMVKVKWSRYRPGVAQRVGRGIALLFHDCGTRRGWVVSSTPRPHFTGGKSRLHRDSIPDRPARSQSLYRPSYLAHIFLMERVKKCIYSFISGNQFALMESKLALVHLLSRFNIRVIDKTPLPMKIIQTGFSLSVEGGFWFGLELRSS